MADFCRWGYAVAEAMGIGGKTFLEAYYKNIGKANQEAINASPVAAAVVALMKDRNQWDGRTSELWIELQQIAEAEKIDTKARSCPKAANVLARRLTEAKSDLGDAGICCTVQRDTKTNVSMVSLKRAEKISGIQAGESFHAGGTKKTGRETSGEPPALKRTGERQSGGTGDTGGAIGTSQESEKKKWKGDISELF